MIKRIHFCVLSLLFFFAGLEADIIPIDSLQGYANSSPYVGQVVTTVGVVTATPSDWIRSLKGFFIQDAEAPWHGIYVYTGNLTISLQRGDSVEVTGEVSEYYDKTEINLASVQDLKILKHGARMPKPLLVTALEAGSEAYEGVLIQVSNVTVTNDNLGYGEWEISDSTGSVRVDDAAGYSYTPTLNDHILSVIGVLDYSYGNYKIEPRRDEDIIFSPEGTGYAFFENNTVAADDTLNLRLHIQGIVEDTLQNIEIKIPYQFYFSANLNLEGDGFQVATYSISGSGTSSDPYTIIISNATVTRDLEGIVNLLNIGIPSAAGQYTFEVYTSKTDTVKPIPDSPVVNVLTVEGSGIAIIYPIIYPLQANVDAEISITNNFGTLQKIMIIFPQDISWEGDYTLLDPGFSNATATFTDTSLYITGALLSTGNSGRIVLRNINFQTTGVKTFRIFTGGSDTLREIQESPRVFVALQDTTVPLYVFHTDTLKEFLKGRTVKIKGVVTGITSTKAYLQDSTGGLILYQPPELHEGDYVKLEGQYNDFHGSDQLYSAEIINHFGQSSFDTLLLTTPPGEHEEGLLVRVNNLTPPAGLTTLMPDTTLTFRDPHGYPFHIYIETGSELAYREIPPDSIDIMGNISEFDGTYQINPRRLDDIILKGNGTGKISFYPPYLYKDQAENLYVIIKSTYTPVKSMELSFKGATFDTLVLLGSGWGNISAPDSLVRDTQGTYMQFLGGISLRGDTIVFTNFYPSNEVDSIVFNIKTSKDSAGLTIPVMQDLILYVAIPIADVQAPGDDGVTPQDSGEVVTVCGVVTAPPRIFSTTRTSFYIQDRTSGVNVYLSSTYIPLEPGDLVKVRGTVTEYNGLTEIAPSQSGDIKIIGKGEVPEPYILSQGEPLREELEGLLVKIKGEVAQNPYTSGSGKAFTVWNGTVPVDIYVYNSTGIDLTSVKSGDVVEITGICGQYDSSPPYTSGYQILPREDNDIQLLGTTISGEINLSVTPNVFSPALGEALEIKVEGPLDAQYYLKIFDSRGKLIRTLMEGTTSPRVVYWKGENESGRIMPIGSYIVVLDVSKPDGTHVKKHKLVILSKPR